jgi:DNA-binding HxlR family transcriptional regulator
VEYQLTKVGIALRPALRALLAWAALRKEAMQPSS